MALPARKTFSIPNDTAYLAEVRQAVTDVVRQGPFPERDQNLITLAVDEAVANIMKHAYRGQPAEMTIEVDLRCDAQKFEAIIRDSGQPFDPSTISDVNLGEHLQLGKTSGLGLFLMRQIMDEVNYSFREGARNQLQMVKYVDNLAADPQH